jgi:hypothetical protein
MVGPSHCAGWILLRHRQWDSAQVVHHTRGWGMVQHFEKAAGQVLSIAELAVVLLAVFGVVLGVCFKCLDGGASCAP